jgi:hypothetical protein
MNSSLKPPSTKTMTVNKTLTIPGMVKAEILGFKGLLSPKVIIRFTINDRVFIREMKKKDVWNGTLHISVS